MMAHTLPPLPYDYAALEPWIDRNTLRAHHDFHHWKCVVRLNSVERALLAVPTEDRGRLQRLERLAAWCAAEHALHCLSWDIMGPHQGGRPRGDLADQITDDFGSFTDLKLRFAAAAGTVRAGGWIVLSWEPAQQQLAIFTFDRYTRLAAHGDGLLLALDMWPHAYVGRYRTHRAEYVHNWWNTVNWPRVAQAFYSMALAPRTIDAATTRREGYETLHTVEPGARRTVGTQHAGAR